MKAVIICIELYFCFACMYCMHTFIQTILHIGPVSWNVLFFCPQTSRRPQATTSTRTCRDAHLCVKQAKTAVTWWPAASVAHTLVSTTASARKDITARVCSTNAQVGPYQESELCQKFNCSFVSNHGLDLKMCLLNAKSIKALQSMDKCCWCSERKSQTNSFKTPPRNSSGNPDVHIF